MQEKGESGLPDLLQVPVDALGELEEEPEVVENVIGGVCGPHCSVEISSSKNIARKKRALFQ